MLWHTARHRDLDERHAQPNIDEATVEGFGAEWSTFDQSAVAADELDRTFRAYFAVFPWQDLPPSAGHAGRSDVAGMYLPGRDPADAPRSGSVAQQGGKAIERIIAGERFDCVAAGLQGFLEETVVAWVQAAVRATGVRRVALSAGLLHERQGKSARA